MFKPNIIKDAVLISTEVSFNGDQIQVTPLVFVSGILLGTAFSIFFGLAVVALLMAMLGVETPRVEAEIKPLLSYSALFLLLTATSAFGFITLLKKHRLRWVGQAVLWSSWLISIVTLIRLKT